MNRELAGQGLRVLALAYRNLHESQFDLAHPREEVEHNCTFVGLVGIRDPPRDGVPEAIQVRPYLSSYPLSIYRCVMMLV